MPKLHIGLFDMKRQILALSERQLDKSPFAFLFSVHSDMQMHWSANFGLHNEFNDFQSRRWQNHELGRLPVVVVAQHDGRYLEEPIRMGTDVAALTDHADDVVAAGPQEATVATLRHQVEIVSV